MEKVKRKMTIVEMLVIFTGLTLIISIFWPISCGCSGSKGNQVTCTSNQRKLAVAATMYAQDNHGRWPGVNDGKGEKYVGWVENISPFLKENDNVDIFYCPDVKNKSVKPVSYGYNASLLTSDGYGITNKDILQPTQVGVFCDAVPLVNYPRQGGIIGGTALLFTDEGNKGSQLAVKPVGRHGDDVVVCYADGHAQAAFDKYDENDAKNDVNRAFYMAAALGLINNPSACLGGGRDNPFGNINKSAKPGKIVIGGDFAARPLLRAICEVKKKIDGGKFQYSEDGFKGSENNVVYKNYLMGVATGKEPDNKENKIYIGNDAMVVIVNKNCRINIPDVVDLTRKVNTKVGSYKVISLSALRKIISSDGYAYPGTKGRNICLYISGQNDGTRIAIKDLFNANFRIDDNFQGTICNNDFDIMDAVANDCVGIGIISSVFFDYKKVDTLAIKDKDKTYIWNYSDKSKYPFQRKLYAVYAPNTPAADAVELSFKKYKDVFCSGPLYRYSYWR